MKKTFTILSSLIFVAFLTYAYMPPQDILHNPKAIDWHLQQKAYFAKIQVIHENGKTFAHGKNKRWV